MDTPVQMWSLDYHAYMQSALTRDCVRQCRVDIPRMQVTLNGKAVTTMEELTEHLGTGALFKHIVPFVTQTSMYIVFAKLTKLFKIVRDGGKQMSVVINTNEDDFTIDIFKMLMVQKTCIDCAIHVSSTSSKVIITAERKDLKSDPNVGVM